ncbi:MAG: 4-hydroxy-tetrahydrodipicolinate reductase, partial [Caulobacteraceae bacterium]
MTPVGGQAGRAVRVGIAGASGRMGRALAAAASQAEGLEIAARFGRLGAGEDSFVTAEAALAACDVIVDFTSGAASAALATRAAVLGGPAMVIGSTGFSADEAAAISAAGARIAIVKSGNFSIGINVLAGLVEQAA